MLDKNKGIYKKALDFAFDNKDIKNIAITGIYGAGKSTVWNTYVKETKKENIITVSLGKYEDNIQEIKIKSEDNEDKDNNSETKEKDSEAKNKDTEYDKIGEDILDNENRVERQIINQILSQIKAKDIPLSKYGFKSNKSCCTILFETVALLSKLDVDKHINIEIELDELDLTSAESKATYAQIKEYVWNKFELKVPTLYIAQIKRKCGIELREHYNKSKKEKQIIPQCTPEKEEAIMDALRHFKMIE